MNKKQKNIILFFVACILIISWIFFAREVDLEKFVESVGVHNGYLITFIVSLFGGIAVITSTAYIATISTFVLGGLNPYLIAILSGIALTIGDSFIYFLGQKGAKVFVDYENSKIGRFSSWLLKKPKWLVDIFIIFYMGFTPFPNDLITVAMAISKYKYKDFFLPLFIGNILFALVIALLVFYTGKTSLFN